MSTGCHAELKIIKGVAVTPGDTNSAEAGLEVIDLLDPSGFSLKGEDGWSMNRPALKNGGLWADTNLSPGRSLIAGEDGNVTETMQVTLMPGSMPVLAALQSKLERFIQDARAFQDSFGQIEPVYLKHQVLGEPGPRYALIHNIEMTTEDPDNLVTPVRDLTLTIEREPYWRWEVPPGGNPKLWTNRDNPAAFIADPSLITGTNHFAYQSVNNRREWNETQTAVLSQNYIDIPASSIPGDAPALVYLAVDQEGTDVGRYFVSRVSKPTEIKARDGNTRFVYNELNAADGTVGTDASIIADATAPISNSTLNGQRVDVTFATTTTLAARVTWSDAEDYLSLNAWRGRYIVLARLRVPNTGVFQGDIILYQGSAFFVTPIVTLAGGASPSWQVHCMGVITIPLDARALSGGLGKGLQIQGNGAASVDLDIKLEAARVSGTGTLGISDIILIPIDECCAFVKGEFAPSSGGVVIDNTGYLSHGEPGDFTSAIGSLAGVENFAGYAEVQGQSVLLLPRVDNRLYFTEHGITNRSRVVNNFYVRVNIVPRSVGLRTE